MKKRILALLMILALALALGACGAGKDQGDSQTPPDETSQTSPDDSSNSDFDAPAEGGDAPDDGENGDAGAGESEPKEKVKLQVFYGDDNAEKLESETVEIDELTPENIISQLIDRSVIPENVKCNSFDITKAEGDGATVLLLDLSKEFAEAMQSTGTAGESMMIGSLVNTFLTAYNADRINVSVDGATLETGHQIYDEPMGLYTFE